MKYNGQILAKVLIKLINDQPEKTDEIISNFVRFIKDKNLAYLLPRTIKYFKKQVVEDKNKNTLHIQTKNGLSDEIVTKIKQLVAHQKEIKIKIEKDSKLIGGFIAEYKNQVFDASLDNNLRLLRRKLINE